jgi:hypothetical protein
MTAMTPPRIAANDPKLAHALMRHAVISGGSRCASRLNAIMERGAVSVANLSRAIRRAYGPLLVTERITRLHGTRASAGWIVLVDDIEGGVVPIHITLSRAGLAERPLRLRFAPHAVARLAQRTVGAANMEVIAPMLARHLLTVIRRPDRATSTDDFRSATPEGAFIWTRIDGGVFLAVTWLDAAGAADPQVRADCALADASRGVMSVVAVGDSVITPAAEKNRP